MSPERIEALGEPFFGGHAKSPPFTVPILPLPSRTRARGAYRQDDGQHFIATPTTGEALQAWLEAGKDPLM